MPAGPAAGTRSDARLAVRRYYGLTPVGVPIAKEQFPPLTESEVVSQNIAFSVVSAIEGFTSALSRLVGLKPEDQTTQVLCLNLAANAIITWNTVYMAGALTAIRAEGVVIDDDDLAHVPPTLWSHVNVYGKYEFDVETGSRRSGLRPLRQPSAASA